MDLSHSPDDIMTSEFAKKNCKPFLSPVIKRLSYCQQLKVVTGSPAGASIFSQQTQFLLSSAPVKELSNWQLMWLFPAFYNPLWSPSKEMTIFRLKNIAQRKILSDYLQKEFENDSQTLYKLGISLLLFDCRHYWLMLNKKGQIKITLFPSFYPSPHPPVLPERLCSVRKCRFKIMGILSSLYQPGPVFPRVLNYMEKKPPQKVVIPFMKVLFHFLGKNCTQLYLDIGMAFSFPSLHQSS